MKGRWMREKQAAGLARIDEMLLTLTPQERIRTDAGGSRWIEIEPRPPQIWGAIRSGGFKGNDQNVNATADGTVLVVWLTLIGPVGAMVEVHDKFHYHGFAMEVVNVRHEPDGVYAESVRHG